MPDPTPPTPPGDEYATRQLANVAALLRAEAHPRQIGPYTIEHVLGEGGMGVVYRATQTRPIARTVAIKVIKVGLDTREVLRRFDIERQTLALMEHPNIARVLDAGMSETGKPYFVMEFVDGPSLTTYADAKQLTVRQRLELFLQACAAVQHAHQKAIIHRDIKPSNILVTEQDGKPTVRVIDFGVATAMRKEQAERTTFLETGHSMGTPEYMAPEQTLTPEADVDTRTDVYALGVVLYELLSGALPFDARSLRSAGYAEIGRILREVEPPRPSTRLSALGATAQEIARRRQTPLPSLERELRSELEWIPLKAMHKERERRYASAVELAADIENYIANRPLRAGPPSAGYRLRKFVRRNRLVVGAAAAIVALLVGGIAATSWQAVRATRAEAQSQAEARRATQAERRALAERDATSGVNEFLIDMFQSVDPSLAKGQPVLVVDVLDKAAATVEGRFAQQPATEAAIRASLGVAYNGISQFDKAEPQVDRALELYRTLLGEDDDKTLDVLELKGILRSRRGKWAEAVEIGRQSYDRRVKVGGPDSADALNALNNIAVSQQLLGQWKEAEASFRRIFDGYSKLYGPDNPKTLDAERKIGKILSSQARYDEAEAITRRLLDASERVNGPLHSHTISQYLELAFICKNLKRPAEARDLAQVAFDRSLKANGEMHIQTVSTQYMLAMCTADTGPSDRAIALYFDALERSKKVYGPDVPATLSIMNGASTELASAGRYAEAAALQRSALEGLTRTLGPDHPQRLTTMSNLCRSLVKLGLPEDALPLAEELDTRLGPDTKVQFDARRIWRARLLRGVVLSQLGRHAEAWPLLVAVEENLSKASPADDALREAYDALVASAAALGNEADRARFSQRQAAWRAATRPATTKP